MNTIIDHVSQAAPHRFADDAAPMPPIASSSRPMYMNWFERDARSSWSRTAAVSRRLRIRNALKIATPWHIAKTTSPTRWVNTSH